METHPHQPAWPAEWTNRPRSGMAICAGAFLGLLTLSTAAAAVWQAVAGDRWSAVALAGAAIYFGHITGLGLRELTGGRRRTGTTGVTTGPAGLRFRYAAAPTYWLTATAALTVVVLAGLTIVAVLQGGAHGYLIAAVLAVAALLAAAFLTVVLRLAPGQVVVGPDGIHHRGLTFTHDVPWHAVVDVVAVWVNGPLVVIKTISSADTVTRNYLGRSTRNRPDTSFTTVSGSWLTSDPALLLQAVAYYLLHPDDRAELGTSTALRRISG
jgi:hypothetical protein